MSAKKTGAYQSTLTSYARGIGLELQDPITEILAPTVAVGASMGYYKEFNDKNAFQVYNTRRALGGDARRIEFEASDPQYNCSPNALEIGIDDAEREAAGETDPLELEQSKIRTLLTATKRSAAVETIETINAAVSGTAKNWGADGADPISDVDEQILDISTQTGEMPTDIVFGLNAWQYFRLAAKVISRFPGAEIVGVNTIQAAQLLLNPAIRVHISTLVRDTALPGKAKANAQVMGANIWILHSSKAPSLYDPSFAKTFRTRKGGVDAVRKYRDEKARSDILAVDWSQQIKVVSTACARRLTISMS